MCEYCNDTENFDEEFNALGLFKTTENKEYYTYDVYIYKGILRIGCDANSICKLNYCPICGRNLKEEENGI